MNLGIVFNLNIKYMFNDLLVTSPVWKALDNCNVYSLVIIFVFLQLSEPCTGSTNRTTETWMHVHHKQRKQWLISKEKGRAELHYR